MSKLVNHTVADKYNKENFSDSDSDDFGIETVINRPLVDNTRIFSDVDVSRNVSQRKRKEALKKRRDARLGKKVSKRQKLQRPKTRGKGVNRSSDDFPSWMDSYKPSFSTDTVADRRKSADLELLGPYYQWKEKLGGQPCSGCTVCLALRDERNPRYTGPTHCRSFLNFLFVRDYREQYDPDVLFCRILAAMRNTLSVRKGIVTCPDYEAHVSAMKEFDLAPFVKPEQEVSYDEWRPSERVTLAVKQAVYPREWDQAGFKALCFAFSCLQDGIGYVPDTMVRNEFRELKTSPVFSRHLGKRWRAFWEHVSFHHVIVVCTMARLDRQGVRVRVPRAVCIPDPERRRIVLEWWRRLDYPHLSQGNVDVLAKAGVKGGKVQTKHVGTLQRVLAIIAEKTKVLEKDLRGPARLQNNYETVTRGLKWLHEDLTDRGDLEGAAVVQELLESNNYFRMLDFYNEYVEKPSILTSFGRVALASQKLSRTLEQFLKQDSSASWVDLAAFIAGLSAVVNASNTAGRLSAIALMAFYGYQRYPVIANFISAHLAKDSVAKMFLQNEINPASFILAFFPFLQTVWNLMFGRFEISKMWDDIAKSSSQTVGIEKAVYGVLTQLIRLLPERAGAVLKLLRSPVFNDLERLHEDMDRFRLPDKADGTVVIGWFVDESYTKHCCSAHDEVADAAFDFYNRMSGLQHRLALTVRASPVMSNLTSAVSFLRDCANIASKRRKQNIGRPQTAWIHLVGPPNSGKSHLQEQLIRNFVRVFIPGHQDSDVSHQGEDNFLDSYDGQLVEKRDDLFQNTDREKRTEVAAHIIRAVSPGVYLPYMADPAKKGMTYEAHMLVSSSNQVRMGVEAGFNLEDVSALQRRRMILGFVEIDRTAAANARRRTALGESVALNPQDMKITLRHVLDDEHDVYTCTAGEFLAICRLGLMSYPSLTHTSKNFVSEKGGTPSPVFGALFYCTHYPHEEILPFDTEWFSEDPVPERIVSYLRQNKQQTVVPAGARPDWFRVVGECNDLLRVSEFDSYEKVYDFLSQLTELVERDGIMYLGLDVSRDGLDDQVQQSLADSIRPSLDTVAQLQGDDGLEHRKRVIFSMDSNDKEVRVDGSFLIIPVSLIRTKDKYWVQSRTLVFSDAESLQTWLEDSVNDSNQYTQQAVEHLLASPGMPLRFARQVLDGLKALRTKCEHLVEAIRQWIKGLVTSAFWQGVLESATAFLLGIAGVSIVAGALYVIVTLFSVPLHLLTQKPPNPGEGGTAYYSPIFGVNQCGLGTKVYVYADPKDDPWGLWVPQVDTAVRAVMEHYYPQGRFWEQEGSYAWFGSLSFKNYRALKTDDEVRETDMQSINLKIRDIKPAKHGRRREAPKPKARLQNFSPDIANNCFCIWQPGRAGKCFMVSDMQGITNSHTKLVEGPATIQSLDRRNTFQVKIRVRNSEVQGDLCVFTVDKPLSGVKKFSHKFVNRDTLLRAVNLQANCFRLTGTVWVQVNRLGNIKNRFMQDPDGCMTSFSVGQGRCSVPSQMGDCGLPYLFDDDSRGITGLCGIHVAGALDGRVHYIPITRELLEKEFSLLRHTPTMQSMPAKRRNDVPFHEVKPEAKPHNPTKTSLVRTPVYQDVVQQFGKRVAPARLRVFTEGGQTLSPLYKAEDKLRFDLKGPELPMPRNEIGALLNALYPSCALATDLTIACVGGKGVYGGVRYELDPVDLSTSAGWPLNLLSGKKKRDYVDEDNLPDVFKLRAAYEEVRKKGGVAEIMDIVDGGEAYKRFVEQPSIVNWMLIPPIFVGTLKDEKRDVARVEQGKTRMFFSPSMQFVYLGRLCFGAYVALCKQQFVTTGDACGINPVSLDWQELYDNFIRPDDDSEWNLVAGDYSSFDSNIPYAVCEAVAEFLSQRSEAPESQVYLRYMLGPRYTIVDDRCYAIEGGNPSGQYLTPLFNGMANKALLYSCYRYYYEEGSVEAFLQDNRLLTGGDDHVWAQRENIDINMKEVSLFMFEQYGITYTDTSKSLISEDFVSEDEVTFLKRKWRRDPYHPGIFWPELEEDSIIAALTYMHKGAKISDVINSVLYEVALFDEVRFNQWMERLLDWDSKYKLGLTAQQRAGYREASRQALQGVKQLVLE